METGLVRQGGNGGAAIQRTDLFGGREIAPMVETSTAAVAAQAEAEVKARVALAVNRPRDLDTTRLALLKECKRPGFAESARYRRPVGKKKNDATGKWEEQYAEGFSIRFAEAAQRCMGNLYSTSVVVYDGGDKRIVRVSVMDLESNSTFTQDITIAKTVERRKLKDGQDAVGQRQNSTGQMVYIVEASDSELVVKQAAETSKVVRTLILRHVPGDILDECEDAAAATLKKGDAEDPDAARKKIVDGFAKIGVKPADLKAFVGCDLDAMSPAQIGDLRAIYTGINEGTVTWAEIAKERATQATAEEKGETAPAAKLEKLRAAAQAKAAKKQAAPASDGAAPKTEPVTATANVEPASTGLHDPNAQPPADQ